MPRMPSERQVVSVDGEPYAVLRRARGRLYLIHTPTRLHQVRYLLGQSQEEMGWRLGCTKSFVSAVEVGIRPAPADMLARAEALLLEGKSCKTE